MEASSAKTASVTTAALIVVRKRAEQRPKCGSCQKEIADPPAVGLDRAAARSWGSATIPYHRGGQGCDCLGLSQGGCPSEASACGNERHQYFPPIRKLECVVVPIGEVRVDEPNKSA
jgi:hypothetical protein